jgi:antitoxin (DNA-binding transcriptional repressor) of toxin-antitoxin stability system
METKVGIRELKNQLSRYVRQAERGDVILVTDRGHVVAELWPPGHGERRTDIPPGLLEMERKGQIRLATRPNDPSLYRRMPHVDLGARTIEDLMDEIRGD